MSAILVLSKVITQFCIIYYHAQIIRKYDYPSESHTVKTKDNYLLTLHRIPHGRTAPHNTKEYNKPVVFLQHGIICSSADWIISGPDKSLVFILADRGYDVWLGNTRGNTYSRAHVSLSVKEDREFWDFSFDEMGFYDLPAMIDYVLRTTGQHQLSYIGHSVGTTMFYAMASSKPEYNDKIQVMVSLAPVAYLKNAKSVLTHFSTLIKNFDRFFGGFITGEFLSNTPMLTKISRLLCEVLQKIKFLSCEDILFKIFGYDKAQISDNLFRVIMAHSPAGTSLRTILHLIQIYKNDCFQPYDCSYSSKIDKLLHFFTKREKCIRFPPITDYNLSLITTPVTLHYSDNDLIVDEKDVLNLQGKLPNAKLYKVEYPSFNHIDYLYATDAPKLIYETVIQVLKEHQPSKGLQ